MSRLKGADLGLATGLLNYRGAWSASPNPAYANNDLVTRGDTLYVATGIGGSTAGTIDPIPSSSVATLGSAVGSSQGALGVNANCEFTVNAPIQVTQIQFQATTSGFLGGYTAGISADFGTSGTPSWLGSGTTHVTAASAWDTIVLNQPVNLVPGTTYRIVCGESNVPYGVATLSGNVASVANANYGPTFQYTMNSGNSWGITFRLLGPQVNPWTPLAQTFQGTVLVKSAAYTMGVTDRIVLASGTTTITLPPAYTTTQGVRYTVKNTGTGVITVAPQSGTIDGAASVTIQTQYNALDFVTDGTNWYTV